jgi:hypothetical protein
MKQEKQNKTNDGNTSRIAIVLCRLIFNIQHLLIYEQLINIETCVSIEDHLIEHFIL